MKKYVVRLEIPMRITQGMECIERLEYLKKGIVTVRAGASFGFYLFTEILLCERH